MTLEAISSTKIDYLFEALKELIKLYTQTIKIFNLIKY